MAFHEIAVPHRDILSKNFSSEVYAAKLWDVYMGRGEDDYSDPTTFFSKTYLTDNLKSILHSVENTLAGKSGGHFRSISTPFGGGKTHTLIALYHKCAEWGTKPVVIVGHELDPKTQTLWGVIEEQLTGKIELMEGRVSRGGEVLRSVLKAQETPILILIDELLQYITRAAEMDRESNSNLAKMTIAFMQELSEVAVGLRNVCVVITLPSSTNEHLDNEAYMQLYNQLQKIVHRTIDTITPVSDTDIPMIIRQRLFSTPSNEIRKAAESIVDDFVGYCERENLIPENKHPSAYREDFLNSYPFLPQVIDVLYKQWGTIERFQRTRGVLRLLSRVVSSLSTSGKQFISLGDFDLGDTAIRQELVAYLDPQFNGVIAKDIIGEEAGASKVNQMVPDQFRGRNLGIRTATTIFMYSHSGGTGVNGATEAEIKRSTCEPGISPAQTSAVLNLFANHMFYLSVTNGMYMFTKETNVLKIKVDFMDNLRQHEIDQAEIDLVKTNTGDLKELKAVLYPSEAREIADSPPLKLAIMKNDDQKAILRLYNKSGESDRTYRNNLFFLAPSDGEKARFIESLKSMLAWKKIKSDSHIKLTEEQRDTVASELKSEEVRAATLVKDYYSELYVPEKEGLAQHHVRSPPITTAGIDRIVYDYLLDEEVISLKIGTATLMMRYLHNKKVVETSDILKSMLSVPGELRPIGRRVLERTIIEGVANGEFGLGEGEVDTAAVRYFKKQASVSFERGEVLIHASLCTIDELQEYECTICDYKTHDEKDLEEHQKEHTSNPPPPPPPPPELLQLKFEFDVPVGQVNHIGQMLLNIASHYKNFRIKIDASDGKMSKQDIEMIKETLRQIGAKSDL